MNRDAIVMAVFAAFLIGAIVGGWITSIAIRPEEGKHGEAHSGD